MSKRHHIEVDVRNAIADGHLQPEEQLPSELDFKDNYDYSRTTIRVALKELANLKLIVIDRPRGTFVTRDGPKRARAHRAAEISQPPTTDFDVNQPSGSYAVVDDPREARTGVGIYLGARVTVSEPTASDPEPRLDVFFPDGHHEIYDAYDVELIVGQPPPVDT